MTVIGIRISKDFTDIGLRLKAHPSNLPGQLSTLKLFVGFKITF